MINSQLPKDSLEVASFMDKTKQLNARIDAIENGQLFWDNFIKIIDIIIWPVALIIGLYIFKKQIASIIDRFESANVSATGLAFKLQQTTKLIGEGSSAELPESGNGIIAKSAKGYKPKDKAEIDSKTKSTSVPRNSNAESPYQELLELQDAIKDKLINIATENGIHNTNQYSNFALTNDLANQSLIDRFTATKLKALIELNTLGLNSPDVTHEQTTQMKKLFNNLSLS